MTASTISRSQERAGSDGSAAGFGPVLRSEWTKFRTVRGWVVGMLLAPVLIVLIGLLSAAGGTIGCQGPNGVQHTGRACLPHIPYGPGGEVVTDSFYFVHQSLTGNGSITVQVTSLTGEHANLSAGPVRVGTDSGMTPGLSAWSKAGIIIKQSTKQGSAYAAMMVTGANGVRMQYDYVKDTAGLPGGVSVAHPRWLRLVRSGDTITGYDSRDGRNWSKVGTASLTGLPATVQIGMFATSPTYLVTVTSFGGSSNRGGPSQATGVFDHVAVTGTTAGGAARSAWAGTAVGGGQPAPSGQGGLTSFSDRHGTFTVSGSGDIAPVVPGVASTLPAGTIEQSLAGAFIAMIAIVVVAAMFFTAEYRRGLIRTTLSATPRRGQVLAAKAIVAATVTFAVGLVGSVVAIIAGSHLAASKGVVVLPVSALTEARVVVGTAAMLGLTAAFAVALGALLRRSAAAITIAIVAIVLPFLLTVVNVFPPGIGAWLLRLTPAAGLAIEQSIPHYLQVANAYSPAQGVYPLPPFAGFAVLCCWAALALALAIVRLRKADA